MFKDSLFFVCFSNLNVRFCVFFKFFFELYHKIGDGFCESFPTHWYISFVVENVSGSQKEMYRLDYFEEGVHLNKLQDLDDTAEIERSKSFGEFIRARISPALLLPYI